MSKILAALKNNPVRILSILTAALTLAASFGFALTGDQQAALLALAGLILGGGEVARAKVTPNTKLPQG